MENWKTVRLGDVCELIMGTSPEGNTISDNPSNGIEFHQGKTFFGKVFLNESKIYTSAPSRFANAGNVIMSVRAPVGDSNITQRRIAIGRGLCTFNLKDDFEKFYLFYFLNSKIEYLQSKSTGSTFKAVNKDAISDLQIPLPPLEEQKHIAAVLDKCSALIAKYKLMLEKYDTLIKSRFIEMFGNPVKNPMGWENKFGKELFSFSSGKFLDASKRMEKGIPVYGGNGIAWYTDIPLISFDTIIIGRVGAYCGNIKKVQEPVWVTDNAIYIKQFKEKCFNLYFLYELMSYMNFYQYADFSGQPKITQKPLENNKYIIPPIEKQKQFASFVQQIDKSKFAVQKSLEKAETLYKSLMQEYFG